MSPLPPHKSGSLTLDRLSHFLDVLYSDQSLTATGPLTEQPQVGSVVTPQMSKSDWDMDCYTLSQEVDDLSVGISCMLDVGIADTGRLLHATISHITQGLEGLDRVVILTACSEYPMLTCHDAAKYGEAENYPFPEQGTITYKGFRLTMYKV